MISNESLMIQNMVFPIHLLPNKVQESLSPLCHPQNEVSLHRELLQSPDVFSHGYRTSPTAKNVFDRTQNVNIIHVQNI